MHAQGTGRRRDVAIVFAQDALNVLHSSYPPTAARSVAFVDARPQVGSEGVENVSTSTGLAKYCTAPSLMASTRSRCCVNR